MRDNEFVVLDTRAFNEALTKKESLISAYDALNKEYDSIIEDLQENWKGRGAAAFQKDAQVVKTNLIDLFDILKLLCDTLEDCKEIFTECDVALGEYNRNPDAEKL